MKKSYHIVENGVMKKKTISSFITEIKKKADKAASKKMIELSGKKTKVIVNPDMEEVNESNKKD